MTGGIVLEAAAVLLLAPVGGAAVVGAAMLYHGLVEPRHQAHQRSPSAVPSPVSRPPSGHGLWHWWFRFGGALIGLLNAQPNARASHWWSLRGGRHTARAGAVSSLRVMAAATLETDRNHTVAAVGPPDPSAQSRDGGLKPSPMLATEDAPARAAPVVLAAPAPGARWRTPQLERLKTKPAF